MDMKKKPTDVVETILKRPRNGEGGGIPLTRGEVAMLFIDGYAGDENSLPAEEEWTPLRADGVVEASISAHKATAKTTSGTASHAKTYSGTKTPSSFGQNGNLLSYGRKNPRRIAADRL